MEVRRLYIGGLFPEVTETDLKDRFSKFGTVDNIEIKVREQMEGTPVKTFAYINLTAEGSNVKRCIKTFDKTKWKGTELKIQMAKENFLSRLIKERTDQNNREKNTSPSNICEKEIKGPPGTKVPGEENWVVGKYGRVLPVVNLKKEGEKYVKKIDPSKFVHNVKKLDKDSSSMTDDQIKPDELTWQLDVNENEITRKRKYEFTDLKPKHKNRKSPDFDSFQYMTKRDEHRLSNDDTKNSVNLERSYGNSNFSLNSGRKTPNVVDKLVNIKSSLNRQNVYKDQLHEKEVNNKSPKKRIETSDSTVNKSNKKVRLSLESSELSENLKDSKVVSNTKKFSNSMSSYTNERGIKGRMRQQSPEKLDRASPVNYDSFDESDSWTHTNSLTRPTSSLPKDRLNIIGQYNISEDTGFEVVAPDRNTSKMRTKPRSNSLDLKRFDSDGSDGEANKSMPFIPNRDNKSRQTQQRHRINKMSKRDHNAKKPFAGLKKFRGTRMLQDDIETKNKAKASDDSSDLDQNKSSELRNSSKPEQSSGQNGSKPKNKNVNVGMFDSLNEFASGFSSEQILSRPRSPDEDVDDDFYENSHEQHHQKLLTPTYFVKSKSAPGIMKPFQCREELGLKGNTDHVNTAAVQGSSSSDSESSGESEPEETEISGKKALSDKPVDHESSSSDDESTEDSEVEETTSNKMKPRQPLHKCPKSGKPTDHESSSSESESNGESETEKRKGSKTKGFPKDLKKSNSNKPTVAESSSSDSESSVESETEEILRSKRKPYLMNSNKPIAQESISSKSESTGKNDVVKTPGKEIKEDATVDKDSASNKTKLYESSSSDNESSGESDQEIDVKSCVKAEHRINRHNDPLSESDSSSDNEDKTKSHINKKGVRGIVNSDSGSSEESDEEIERKNKPSFADTKSRTENNCKSKDEKQGIKGKENNGNISKSQSLHPESLIGKDSSKQVLTSNDIKSKNISKISENKKQMKEDNKIIHLNDVKEISESHYQSKNNIKVKSERSLNTNDGHENVTETSQKVEKHTPNSKEVEKRRLAAVQQKYKENLKQAATVQYALSNMGGKINKKVVFDDDDSEDDLDPETTETPDAAITDYIKHDDDDDESSENDDTDVDYESVKKQTTKTADKTPANRKQISQTDSSSSSDDESDDDDDDDDNDVDQKSNEKKDKQTSAEKKLTLFDSSSDDDDDGDNANDDNDSDDGDDDDDNDDKRFAVRRQFEGASGAKLLELQASYGNDKRFHLDERFAESDSEDDINQGDETNHDEKQNALKILESVVGFKVTTEKTDKKQSNFKDISSLHYDPTREEHKEFELKKDDKSTKKSKMSEETTDTNKDKPEDDEASKKMQERFVEVSDTFKKSLTAESKTEGAQTFSLLQAFGAKGSDVDEEDIENKGTEESQNDKMPLDVRFLRRPDKDLGMNDDDEMDVDDGNDGQMNSKGSIKTGGPLKEKVDRRTFFFFFKEEDERMKVSTPFYRTEDLDVIREQWKKEKNAHIQKFKLKAKNFSRKKTQPGHEKYGDIFERRRIDQRLKNLHKKK